MRKSLVLGTLAALCCAGPAMAADVSYSYLEAGYVANEIDDFDVDGDGYLVRGSVGIGKSFYVLASYADADYDFDIGAETLQIGGGVHWPLNPNLDALIELAYVDYNVDVGGLGSGGEDGYTFASGVRGRVAEKWDVRVDLRFTDVGSSEDTSVFAGARYYLTPQFALGPDVGLNGDGFTWGVFLRYDFGNR